MRPHLTLFWCIGTIPHVSRSDALGRHLTFWCIRMRPHVSHSDASGWAHISHSDALGREHMSHLLMHQDETTCLMLFWCIRMRPCFTFLMHRNENTCLMFWCVGTRPHLTFWCIGMRPHVSHCSDASGWDYTSHIVLMHRNETVSQDHIWHSDALGRDHMSHESASATVLLLCTSLSAQSCSACHDVSLITFVLCGMRPSCNDLVYFMLPKCICFIHNTRICPCFLCLFRLFCIIVLMFHNFLQPNWHIHFCMEECDLLGVNLFWSRLDWTGSERRWVVTSCGYRIAWTLSYFLKLMLHLCCGIHYCYSFVWYCEMKRTFSYAVLQVGIRIAQSI
jgi:hypothetical protein